MRGKPVRMLSFLVNLVTLIHATQIRVKRGQNLDGKQNMALKRCAGIVGTGIGRIRMGIDKYSMFIMTE